LLIAAARAVALALLLAVAAVPGRDSVVGAVFAVSPGGQGVVLRKDGGGELTVSWNAGTTFLRARPGATSLEGATPVEPAQIADGDRLLCRGTLDPKGTTLSANRVVLMTRADVEGRREREHEDWRRRGVTGVVSAVDAARQEIALRVSQNGTAKTLMVDAGAPGVRFRRYAPGSIRFADARPSTLGELTVGDQVRVLGNRSADGLRVAAEEVVSGAFRVVRGTVATVDLTAGTLAVHESGRAGSLVPVTVRPDSLLRRLPPMMVARLLRAAEGAVGAAPAAGSSPGGTAGGWNGAGRAPDPDEAFERLPAVTLGDVSRGDEIAVLGPKQASAAGLPAIKVAVWATPQWPSGRGVRGAAGGQGQADPFTELLGAGEMPW
jgi:hypothetical protein